MVRLRLVQLRDSAGRRRLHSRGVAERTARRRERPTCYRRYTFAAPLWDNSQFNRIDVYLYSPAAYVNQPGGRLPLPRPPPSTRINVNTPTARSYASRRRTSDGTFAPHFQSMGVVPAGIYLRSFNQAWVADVAGAPVVGR